MRIALAGNPNSGKTTMYNALTGRNERVGNWSFPNKRILTNNLCVLACKILMYNRMTLNNVFFYA